MKKIVILLLFVQSAYAFHGFYGGVNLGAQINIAQGENRNSISFFNLFADEVYTTSNRASLSQNGGTCVGALYAGYGFGFFGEVLGLEGFVNFSGFDLRKDLGLESNLNYKDSSDAATYAEIFEALDYQVHVRARIPEFGLDLKPGMTFLGWAFIYARVGVAFNRFDMQANVRASYNDASSIVGQPTHVEQHLPIKQQRTVAGLRAGFGMEYLFCYCVGFTLDYIFTTYGHIKLDGVQETITPYGTIPDGLQVYNNASLTKHAVMVGLSYHM